MFDRDFNPIIGDPSQSGFVRLSDDAKEDDETITADPVNGVEHELLESTVTVKQAAKIFNASYKHTESGTMANEMVPEPRPQLPASGPVATETVAQWPPKQP